MTELGGSLDAYRSAAERFRWDVPAAFNFGRDVVDRYARGPKRPALFWRDAEGHQRELDFSL